MDELIPQKEQVMLTWMEFQTILILIQMAMDGNLGAYKILLSYSWGKPPKASNPDEVDTEEWDLEKRKACIITEAKHLNGVPYPEPILEMNRLSRDVATEEWKEELWAEIEADEREREKKKVLFFLFFFLLLPPPYSSSSFLLRL